ncbi:MAG: SAM-dependent methyltransferase, partial [Oscillospiraceae bacterium]
KDEDARRTVQFSMCAPLAAMISEQYGPLSEEIMNAFFARPKNCARVNTIKTTGSRVAEKLAALGIAARPGEHADSLIIDGEGWLDSSPFRDGSLRLQSAAAQLAVHALKSKPGMSVLDMCAAPGGKTLTCAQIMDNTGRIVALDRSENRLKLLEKQALLEGVSIVETKCADASTYDDGELYDRVLCDVPCSGYGEISSKPELRYKPPAKDSSLWETQRAILERGADRVKPGGMLVYSTCTLDCRENEDVSQEFEARQSNFRVIVADSGEKYSKIIPTADDPEGFFVVTFERMC